jgi:hypothetical protein
MAKIAGRPTVELKVTIELTEEEAKALDALFGYSCDAFLETFYEKMGTAYLQPHEAGFRSLHASGRFLASEIGRARKARQVFDEH